MPFWLPVVGATSLVVGAVLVVKTQAFANNAVEEAQPPHGTVLGHGSFGRVALHKEGAACFALKSIPHRLLQSRNMEKALRIEREALALGTWGNEKDIKFHAACVAEAVAFIHERRVTHRDIKPPNFLLDAQGHCKLAARRCEDWRRPSTDLCRNSTVPCS
jgi:hypothetical protein